MILYLLRIEVSLRIVKGCTLQVRENTLIKMFNSVCYMYAVCQKAILTRVLLQRKYSSTCMQTDIFYKAGLDTGSDLP